MVRLTYQFSVALCETPSVAIDQKSPQTQGVRLLESSLSRRTILSGSLALVAASALPAAARAQHATLPGVSFDVLRQPDLVRIQIGTTLELFAMSHAGTRWVGNGAELLADTTAAGLTLLLNSPAVAVRRIHLRWRAKIHEDTAVLGDAWERSYGDLAWLPLRADRVLPWYFLCASAGTVQGAGVMTGASALAFWQVDAEGISLWLDVRNGGEGVMLGQRTLRLATVVQHGSEPEQSAWQAAIALCKGMAARENVARKRGSYSLATIYGSNDWYYAYGRNTAAGILRDADLVHELAPASGSTPFCIVDDGYQDSTRFPSMARLAEDIRSRHVAPGIWIRPLRATTTDSPHLMLPQTHWVSSREGEQVYDPTIQEARQRILQVVNEACDWGYDFIKHDFTTYELLGQWGSTMGASPTRAGWNFNDRSRTNAEIIRALYQDIRTTAGPYRIILGCNTIGHLSVGIFDGSRTGDDVSGRDWDRTRRMGVNTLAFRLPQNRIFFATDADCVPITPDVAWPHTEAWLHAVAASGSVLLVSPDPKAIGPVQKQAIRSAFALAGQTQDTEPLDWMQSAAPSRWKMSGKEQTFQWLEQTGASPFQT